MCIDLRDATIDDCNFIFNLRNQPYIRSVCWDDREINYDNHVSWYKSSLNNSNRLITICLKNDNPIGVIRFDLNNGEALVSIFLDKKTSGKGYGKKLLSLAENRAILKWKSLNRISAEILEKNPKSRAFFEKNGYNKHAYIYHKNIKNEQSI